MLGLSFIEEFSFISTFMELNQCKFSYKDGSFNDYCSTGMDYTVFTCAFFLTFIHKVNTLHLLHPPTTSPPCAVSCCLEVARAPDHPPLMESRRQR